MVPPDDPDPEFPTAAPRDPSLPARNLNPEISARRWDKRHDSGDTPHKPASPTFADMLAMARAQEQAKVDRERDEHVDILWRDHEARAARRRVFLGMLVAIATGCILASAPPSWLIWLLSLWRRFPFDIGPVP